MNCCWFIFIFSFSSWFVFFLQFSRESFWWRAILKATLLIDIILILFYLYCRRKKKCIRYMEGDNDERTNDGDDMRGGNISDDNLGSCGSVDDVKTPPEDDIESLNHSLSSPGAFSGLSYLQSPSTNLASPLRTNSILYNSNNLSQTHTENSHNSVNDSNNNSNPNNSTNSHNISSIIKWYFACEYNERVNDKRKTKNEKQNKTKKPKFIRIDAHFN